MTFFYLLLSSMSGFLELGAVALPVRLSGDFRAALLIGIAYQLGAFLMDVAAAFRTRLFIAASALGGLALAQAGSTRLILLAPAMLLVSLALQTERELLRAKGVPKWAKRVARITGFSASGFFRADALTGIAVILFIAACMIKSQKGVALPPLRSRLGGGAIRAVMLLHQAQYFCYAYTVPFIFIAYHHLLGFPFASAYALGWVTYTFAFLVFKHETPLRSLVLGHVLVGASLAFMFWFSTDLRFFLTTSLLAGLGGGTVFCLELLRARWGERNVDMILWEDIGHLVGLSVALSLFLITRTAEATLLAGALVAVTTALVAAVADKGRTRTLNAGLTRLDCGPQDLL